MSFSDRLGFFLYLPPIPHILISVVTQLKSATLHTRRTIVRTGTRSLHSYFEISFARGHSQNGSIVSIV
jgi:hypothetical protein